MALALHIGVRRVHFVGGKRWTRLALVLFSITMVAIVWYPMVIRKTLRLLGNHHIVYKLSICFASVNRPELDPGFVPMTGVSGYNADDDILSRILHPDVEGALLLGRRRRHFPPLALAVSSVARRGLGNETNKYLLSTVRDALSKTSAAEKNKIVIVVGLMDQSPNSRIERVSELVSAFPSAFSSGLLLAVAPSLPIHPPALAPRDPKMFTHNYDKNKVSWRSRVALDFAFLLSYCSRLEGVEIVMNLEDDVRVAENFVSKILQFRRSLEKQDWISFLTSKYLSVGRIYSVAHIPGLISFMLSVYQQQPADWAMNLYEKLIREKGRAKKSWSRTSRNDSFLLSTDEEIVFHAGSYSSIRDVASKKRRRRMETGKNLGHP